jgi:hypothetical protein
MIKEKIIKYFNNIIIFINKKKKIICFLCFNSTITYKGNFNLPLTYKNLFFNKQII